MPNKKEISRKGGKASHGGKLQDRNKEVDDLQIEEDEREDSNNGNVR